MQGINALYKIIMGITYALLWYWVGWQASNVSSYHFSNENEKLNHELWSNEWEWNYKKSKNKQDTTLQTHNLSTFSLTLNQSTPILTHNARRRWMQSWTRPLDLPWSNVQRMPPNANTTFPRDNEGGAFHQIEKRKNSLLGRKESAAQWVGWWSRSGADRLFLLVHMMSTQLSRTKAPCVSPIHSITLKDILGGMAGVDCCRQVWGYGKSTCYLR